MTFGAGNRRLAGIGLLAGLPMASAAFIMKGLGVVFTLPDPPFFKGQAFPAQLSFQFFGHLPRFVVALDAIIDSIAHLEVLARFTLFIVMAFPAAVFKDFRILPIKFLCMGLMLELYDGLFVLFIGRIFHSNNIGYGGVGQKTDRKEPYCAAGKSGN